MSNPTETGQDTKPFAGATGSASGPPKYIWADCDPAAPKPIRWAFYRTKSDQRGNRPDLDPIRLRVVLDEQRSVQPTCPCCHSAVDPEVIKLPNTGQVVCYKCPHCLGEWC